MREIKFRAYQDNEMYTQPISGVYGAKRFLGFLYEDSELMQYTGSKDKNGKEIYEGDICSVHQFVDVGGLAGFSEGEIVRKCIVKYILEGAQFGFLEIGSEDEGFIDFWMPSDEGIDIIGNIHENPDLLK